MTNRNGNAAAAILSALVIVVSLAACAEDDGGSTTSEYCDSKCAYEAACGDAADADACQGECAAFIEGDLAAWDGVCVEEYYASEICVYDAARGNGCDDGAAEDACEAETQALLDCFCSDLCMPPQLGDGTCDSGCNNAECNYDEGDCA
jgi:hypothetical protein